MKQKLTNVRLLPLNIDHHCILRCKENTSVLTFQLLHIVCYLSNKIRLVYLVLRSRKMQHINAVVVVDQNGSQKSKVNVICGHRNTIS